MRRIGAVGRPFFHTEYDPDSSIGRFSCNASRSLAVRLHVVPPRTLEVAPAVPRLDAYETSDRNSNRREFSDCFRCSGDRNQSDPPLALTRQVSAPQLLILHESIPR